ncbi:MAG: hypothetical protein QM764_12010 [Chitinophagaceae bacterium]
MKKLLVSILMFSVIAVYASDKGTWTGFIGDAHCGVKGNNAEHAECAKKCVKGGEAPVLVVGDKVYTLKNPKKVAKFIGDKVTISGTLTGDEIEIDKVTK